MRPRPRKPRRTASRLALATLSCLLLAAASGVAEEAPRLPDGGTASAGAGDIAAAWYVQPTTRYGHGILGDRIEAGGLAARTHGGEVVEAILPQHQVFEDLTPRIVDLDGDGRNEVVVIRTDIGRGASLAVYALAGDKLAERAATRPIGRANRWLNVAAIADLDGDGLPEIAIVRTPHIGGTLEIYAWRAGRLELVASRAGYSNHVAGSRDLDLAEVVEIRGGPALVLPVDDRRALAIVRLSGASLATVGGLALPAPAAGGLRRRADGGTLQVRLEDGRTLQLDLGAAAN